MTSESTGKQYHRHVLQDSTVPIAPNQLIIPSMADMAKLKLQAFAIRRDGSSEYRFLVDDSQVKYVLVDTGALLTKNLINFPCHPRVLGAALPPFPPGDWNIGCVRRCPVTHKPQFGSTMLDDLFRVRGESLWHPTTVDASQLAVLQRLRQDVHVVTCPQFKGRVVYKHAAVPRTIGVVQRETLMYKIITDARGARRGPFWAPRFLAHVTEASPGRVVGFLLEYISGRPARGEEDLRMCLGTLDGLFSLTGPDEARVAFTHGWGWERPIKREDFIIRTVVRNGKSVEDAVLIDYSNAGRVSGEDRE